MEIIKKAIQIYFIMVNMTAIQSFRRLAHFSTVRNVDRLICCVRDGYRSYPAAMAAILSYKEDFL